MVYHAPADMRYFPPLGGGPPLSATVGVASSVVVQAAPGRKQLTLTNDSDTIIYVSRGDEARLNAGLRLNANGGTLTDSVDALGRIYNGPWSAISSVAAKILLISEDR